jgi:hypothetical protein
MNDVGELLEFISEKVVESKYLEALSSLLANKLAQI